jgi:hypothetical protein
MTDQPKHTPPPWGHTADTPTFDGATLDVAIFIGHGSGKGGEIAMLRHDPGDGLDVTTEESKANARLIAAAPDLLNALRTLVSHFDDSRHDFDPCARAEAVGLARAAISNATGQPVKFRDDDVAQPHPSASSA